jgi:outer membrane protein assembly factor BamB
MKTYSALILFVLLAYCCKDKYRDQIWPQFRGVNGTGIASEFSNPPITFEDKNLIWKTELPVGASSPVIWNDKLFLTGFVESNKELQTICINRRNGKILWKKFLNPNKIENYSTVAGSPAQSSVTTDGERVIAYFGSCGLISYDMQGNLQWEYPLVCNEEMYGSATSPVITVDKVILINDFGSTRFLLALNKKDGREVWKSVLPGPSYPAGTGYSSPCIYNDRIFVHLVGEISSFSIADGSLLSKYQYVTKGVTSPIIGGDKVIAACWYNLSEEDQRGNFPPYDELIKKYDKNHNGTVSKTEFPDDMILFQRPEIKEFEGANAMVKYAWDAFDNNHDNELTHHEWDETLEYIKNTFYKPADLIAFKVDASGELTDSAILWRVRGNIPEVPSPIFYKQRIYMIKDGGILTCVDSESGKIIYNTRIGNPGPYIASPVAGNGQLYITGFNGKMKVIKADDSFKVIGQHDFKENIAATPAIIGNTIYIRTKTHLFAYSNK